MDWEPRTGNPGLRVQDWEFWAGSPGLELRVEGSGLRVEGLSIEGLVGHLEDSENGD